jgi:formyl-CoA transferase
VLGALCARERTGRGQRVETSLLQATLSFLGENAARYFEEGDVPDRRTRTRTALVFAFIAGDGKPFVVHLSSPTKFWTGLCGVVGRKDWIDDARFADKDRRRENYDELEAALAGIFATMPRQHWLDGLLAADVPAAPVYTLDEVLDDPQVRHLGMVTEVPHPKLGTVKLIEGGVRLSDTPTAIRTVAPTHGEHTAEVLAGLGITPGRAAE